MKKNSTYLISLGLILFSMISCKKDTTDELPLSVGSIIENNLISAPANTTSFQRIIGGTNADAFYSVKQTNDTGYILAGFTANLTHSSRDIIVIKTNSLGETEWLKKYSGDYSDTGWDIQLTSDNGYIILTHADIEATSEMSPTSYDSQLLKLSSDGSQQWKKSYSFGEFTSMSSVRETADGGFIAAGTEYDSDSGIILRVDQNGIETWRQVFMNEKEFRHLDLTDDGGAILSGKDESNSSQNSDILVMKIDNNGNEEWSVTYGDEYDNTSSAIKVSSDGYVICGYNTNTPDGANGYVRSLDENGIELWYKDYGSENITTLDNLYILNDNNIVLVGRQSLSSMTNCYILKVDGSNGEVLWQREFNFGDYDFLLDLQQTLDDGFIIAGNTKGSGNLNGLMIKTDTQGN